MKSPCNVLKGTVMANTVMLSCAGYVQAVKAPHNYFACLRKHVRTYYAIHVVQACADVTCYALWAGMCASHVLCKLLCGSCHGSGVQKHV